MLINLDSFTACSSCMFTLCMHRCITIVLTVPNSTMPYVQHYQKDADGLCCRLKHSVEKKSGNIEYTVSLQDFKESKSPVSNLCILAM